MDPAGRRLRAHAAPGAVDKRFRVALQVGAPDLAEHVLLGLVDEVVRHPEGLFPALPAVGQTDQVAFLVVEQRDVHR